MSYKKRKPESVHGMIERLKKQYTPEELDDLWDIGKQLFRPCRTLCLDMKEIKKAREEYRQAGFPDFGAETIEDIANHLASLRLRADYYINKTNMHPVVMRMLVMFYMQGEPWANVQKKLKIRDIRTRKKYAKYALIAVGEAVVRDVQAVGKSYVEQLDE